MNFLDCGEKARKTVRKDEHDMDNVDEFFNDTTEMSKVGSYSPSVMRSMTPARNILRAHSQSEINQQKSVKGLNRKNYYVEKANIPVADNFDPIIGNANGDLDKPYKENTANSYETNYGLDSENEISINDCLSDGNGSKSVPDLNESNSSSVSEETPFNTSENAILEQECEPQDIVSQSVDLFQEQDKDQDQLDDYVQSSDISDALANDSYDSQDNAYVDDHITQTRNKIRKSTRIKVPTLDYWRNERIVYRRNHPHQSLNIDKIITFVEDRQAKKEITKKCNKKARQVQASSPIWIQDNDSKWLKDGLLTIRPSGTSENVIVAMAPLYQQSGKTKSTKFNNFTVNTFFKDQENFASGQLKMPVKGLKSQDNIGECSATFHVTKGVVKFWINGQPFTCPTETTIQVPAFNTYKIVNIGKTEAIMFFVQVFKETKD